MRRKTKQIDYCGFVLIVAVGYNFCIINFIKGVLYWLIIVCVCLDDNNLTNEEAKN